jgi:hypothetical protein
MEDRYEIEEPGFGQPAASGLGGRVRAPGAHPGAINRPNRARPGATSLFILIFEFSPGASFTSKSHACIDATR